MDGSRLSPFPHHSWLGFRVRGRAGGRPLCVNVHGVIHTVSLTVAGSHSIRQVGGRHETRWTEACGTVNFIPADDEQRTFLTTPEPLFESAVLVIPRRHLGECLATDGLDVPRELGRILAPDDPVLRECMQRLTTAGPDDDADARKDEAGRRLVLRLAELGGGGVPDWHDDASMFDRRTLDHLVAHIDASLRIAPGLAEMARLTGHSPSHFARKFRTSTGLSLLRFVNYRRLRAALEILRAREVPIADLAHELGFSSQSHLTRLFRGLTGMTPARYRRQCAPTVG